ncbi:hypothetical protein BDQ17DRAFT_1424372 [Cyathus striatus]|nr:hypothetical protein BDQ17DRAFT_1424372 [Cyathus striatus]
MNSGSALSNEEHADVHTVITIKIFSIVPVSIVDERAMSVVSWLNGPKHKSQKISTVADHLIICQYNQIMSEKEKPKPKPLIIKWHDIHATIKKMNINIEEADDHEWDGNETQQCETHPQDPASNILKWLDEGLPNEVMAQDGITFTLATCFNLSHYSDILDNETSNEEPSNLIIIDAAVISDTSLTNQTVPMEADWLMT